MSIAGMRVAETVDGLLSSPMPGSLCIRRKAARTHVKIHRIVLYMALPNTKERSAKCEWNMARVRSASQKT